MFRHLLPAWDRQDRSRIIRIPGWYPECVWPPSTEKNLNGETPIWDDSGSVISFASSPTPIVILSRLGLAKKGEDVKSVESPDTIMVVVKPKKPRFVCNLSRLPNPESSVVFILVVAGKRSIATTGSDVVEKSAKQIR